MAGNSLKPMTWWGSFELPADGTAGFEMGPLALYITRQDKEWQINYKRNVLENEEVDHWKVTMDCGPLEDTSNLERFAFHETGPEFRVKPVLADRPVVTRPVTPLHMLSGQEITVYVSSPLFVRVEVHDPPVTLREIPIQLLSDTWFGPSTREGELAYASRTSARLMLDRLPPRSVRAVTPVLIRNRSGSPLLLDRLSLPVPYLALYAAGKDFLWTQAVTLDRESDTEMAKLQIEDKPPKQARDPERLSDPRQASEKGMLVRAFSALFR